LKNATEDSLRNYYEIKITNDLRNVKQYRCPVLTEFATRDVEIARAALEQTYGGTAEWISATPLEPFELRHERRAADRLAFDRFRARFDLEMQMLPTGRLTVCHVHEGEVQCSMLGRADTYTPGHIYVTAAPDQPHLIRMLDAGLSVTQVDLKALAAAAGRRSLEEPAALRFHDHRPVTQMAEFQWERTVAYLRDEVLADPEVTQSPLAMGAAAAMLARQFLSTFPSTAVTEPTARDRTDASAQTVRRSIAFMEAHIQKDIDLPDIAAAAGVTPRSVQLAFTRHFDMTPMRYLRRIRLKAAHEDLRAGALGTTSVQQISAKWGFLSASRFTEYYRWEYGKLPSETLKS
jgi:AraC-like DNA-binding protein